MKRLAMMTAVLVALGGAARAQSPTTTTTSTTAQTPVGTVTTTTDVTTPAAPVPAPVVPTARDAISGQPVDYNAAADANDDVSLRDKVRTKISDEAQVKQ